jgi:hypothetical protein
MRLRSRGVVAASISTRLVTAKKLYAASIILHLRIAHDQCGDVRRGLLDRVTEAFRGL